MSLGLLACSGTEPTNGSSETGHLEITSSTTGEDRDANGYTVSVDGGSGRSIGTDGSITFSDLAAGDHAVELSNVASNCSVSGSNPRTVTVPEGDTVATIYEVACTSTDGGGSAQITGISFDGSSLNRFANNGDIYPVTWAADDHLYTAGGDGDGWDGTDTRGMDVNRLAQVGPTGDLSNGTELFSKEGVLPKGLISVGGALYVLEQERGNGFARSRIGKSTDGGQTWTYNGDGSTTWDFTTKAFSQGHFINYGRDNAQARDEFVYLTGIEDAGGGGTSPFDQIVLARAPNTAVQDISQYEYFSGTSSSPAWSSSIGDRAPVFSRSGEIHWGATINYNPVLDRYLLSFFTDNAGTLAVYEGPEPWGPWTKIHEATLVDTEEKYSLFFANKDGWLSSDGTTWWVVTSGMNEWDSFNVLKATLSTSQ